MAKSPADHFSFKKQARTPGLIAALAAIYFSLAILVVVFDTTSWIVAFLTLPTLPALWDLWRNPRSELNLDNDQIKWSSGNITSSLSLSQIDYVRFDTRWDFSVRVTFVLTDGSKHRLPPQVMPSHHQFETALQSLGLGTQRHHFRIF